MAIPGVLRYILAFVGALLGGVATAILVERLRFELSTGHEKALAEYAGMEGTGSIEALGRKLLRYGWVQSLLPSTYFRWLDLVEGEGRITPAMVVGKAAGLTLVLLAAAIITRIPAVLGLALIGAAYPFVNLRSRANEVKKQVVRSLPDVAALMAAEMAAGSPPDKALEQAAEWKGPLAALIRKAVANSQQSGMPLFGRGGVTGVFRSTVAQYSLPELSSFASQVEQVAQKGVGGPELMQKLAEMLVAEYKGKALREAEALENRLAVLSVGFFFLPFLMMLLAPLIFPLLKMF